MMLTILATLAAGVVLVFLLVKLKYPWIKYDIKYICQGMGVLKQLSYKIRNRVLVIDSFENTARERPNNIFIIYQDNNYTYEFVDQKANQVARVGLKLGLKPGDVVSMMMLNEPAFLWTFFGFQKIGVAVSLINYHLRHQALSSSITSCKPKFLIAGQGDDITSALADISDDIKDLRILSYDEPSTGFESMRELMESESSDPVERTHRAGVKLTDVASFIFTSGTTGLPKPAILTQKRSILAQVAFTAFNINEKDILYETLPLYHSAGLNLGILSVVNAGATVLLRTKFSASNFWIDCRKHKVTVIHYIGEMCRYLVNRPKTPEDGVHNIRVAVGNGLRHDIWEEFQSRFKLPNVIEFYAATESPVSFMNIFNIPGVVGRASPIISKLFPAVFVEFDHNTQKARRDANGRCTKIKLNSNGLLICPLDAKRTFDGYYNRPDDNEKKLLRDVFKLGDLYFNTGDLFHLDSNYFVYFLDRTGDTFRWKGENVSTNEVANILSKVDFVHDANVYGVTVPGCEGRAGMAAIHLKEGESLDSEGLKELKSQCAEQLPAYARPKFLRVQRQMSLTSTFKQQKVDLMGEAFDPNKVDEPLYFFDNRSNNYEPISETVFEDIVAGKVTV